MPIDDKGARQRIKRKKKVLIEPFFPSSPAGDQPTAASPVTPKAETATITVPVTPQKNAGEKVATSKLGISISALSEEKQKQPGNQGNKGSSSDDAVLNESFTPIELLNEWKAYTETLTEEHHLKNTMLNCLPDLQNRDTFEVVVNNPVQERRLLDDAENILSVLRKNLKNSKIRMNIRVSVDNEKKLGFTALEKFNLMVEQNETLKRLKDEFGLELM